MNRLFKASKMNQYNPSQPLLSEYNQTPSAPAYPADKIFPGYEHIGSTNPTVIDNPTVDVNIPDIGDERHQFHDIPVLTEDEAKRALSDYVDKKCCYGRKPIDSLIFTDLQSSNTHRYVLQTFCENRTVKWECEPYHGQVIIHNGMRPPLPWEIPVQAPQFFQNQTVKLEVPNTANVQICNFCNATGRFRCNWCYGSGRKQCFSCNGAGCVHCQRTGYSRCIHCSGCGTKPCTHCHGAGKLKWFIQLTVLFENNVDDFIKKSENIPDKLMRTAVGQEIFSEQAGRLRPINQHSVDDINKASHDLIALHSNKFKNLRVLAQRHEVYSIPVTLCKYTFKQQEYEFFVYGLDNQVYTLKYPHDCCCGCVVI